MAITIIPLPAIAKFDDVQWTPIFRNQVNRSAWTGSRQVIGLPGGEHFMVSCSPRPATVGSAERLWRGFIMGLRGTENRFYMPFACNQFPGTTPNPTIVAASAGNAYATLNGVPAGGLDIGMGLTFTLSDGSHQLAIVTADTGAGNNIQVAFQPSLRKNATAVEVKNPYAEVAMTKDNTGWRRSNGVFTVAFEAEESWGM